MLEDLQVGVIKDHTRSYNRFATDSDGNHVRLGNWADLKKPIFYQVVTSEHPELYHKWLETATTLDNDMALFATPFLEKCSRWPWWYIFFMWVPVITLFFGRSLREVSTAWAVASMLTGLFSWTLMEYLLHRFIFHMDTASVFGNAVHFFAHGIHHITPMDTSRLTFPPYFSGMLGIAVYTLGRRLFDPSEGSGFHAWYAGIVLGYLLYDSFHYAQHHGDLMDKWPYLARQKSRHMRHHYHDPNNNFGITTSFWDFVFGTIDMDDVKKD
jgi:sterol desaturase/sphingolipid hydroxylase (fatty acid hydroxylase superfamily)